MKNHPRTVGDYLRADPKLRKLLSRERSQRQLLNQVVAQLPADLKAHCIATVLDNGRLCLYTDTSAWASRLRYFTRELNSRLRHEGLRVDKINVRVLIRNRTRQARHEPVRRLSRENANLILQTSQSIADPELSAALQRLCKHRR